MFACHKEVIPTWGVYEIYSIIFPIECDCSWLYGDASLPLLSHEICDSVSIVHI